MKITAVEVYGLEESIVASGFPMMESPFSQTEFYSNALDVIEGDAEKAYKRAIKLGNTPIGSGHDQCLTGVIVQFNIEMPIKMSVEMQRYHFIDFVSSMSTMHRLTKMDLNDAFDSYVDPVIIERVKELQKQYNENMTDRNYLRLIMSVPVGLNLQARMTTNYRQLKTIYNQRKTHRLPCWREFCDWCLTLPNFKELTGVES